MAEVKDKVAFDRVRTYIEENGGQRLLVGLGLLLLILVLFVFDWVAQKTNDREIELLVLKTDVARMQSLSEATGLDGVLLEFEERLTGFEERAFAADTAGLAAAQIRTVLQLSIEKASLERPQMTVNIEDSESTDVVKFLIELTARESEPGDFAIFLADLASHAQTFFVANLEYSARNRRISVTLEAGAKVGPTS